MEFDHFAFELERVHWLFTIALGIPAGLALAGLWRAYRDRRSSARWPGVGLFVAGGLLALVVATAPVDRLPLTFVDLKLKPYLSVASVAAALSVALSLGIVIGAAPILLQRWPRRVGPWAAAIVHVGVTGAALVAVLAWTQAASDPPRHPEGTDTRARVGATVLVDGLDMPTGVAVGPNGEIAVVELTRGTLSVGHPGAMRTIDLHLGPGALAFHVAFHPEWRAQPYAYVSAEQRFDGRPYLEVVMLRTDGTDEVRPVIQRLPMSEPAEGNHFGSALVFCGGSFFLSVGDTDTILTNPQLSIRSLAQSPSSAAGKVLRFRLEGSVLVPDGLTGGNPPIFAMGFRNPFAMACDDGAGLPVVADNGNWSHDQVRLVTPGSNHEWPMSQSRDALSKPLFDTGGMTIAPTGVAVRDGKAGKEVIFAGFKGGGVYLLQVGGDGRAMGRPRLLSEFDYGVLSLALDGRGCILVADPFSIWRLEEEGCRLP